MEVLYYKLIGFFEKKAHILISNGIAHIVNFLKSTCIYLRIQNCY